MQHTNLALLRWLLIVAASVSLTRLPIAIAEETITGYFVRTKTLAEQGDVGAQTSIGSCYEAGEGVAKDLKQAEVWYRRAAQQGSYSAQASLARLYASQRNYVEAYKWSSIATIPNYMNIFDANAQLRQQVAKSMTREQIGSSEGWIKAFQESSESKILKDAAIKAEQMIQNQETTPPLSPLSSAEYSSTTKPPPQSKAISVAMTESGGVLRVPVLINDTLTLKFVVDSGASEVVIPKDVFLTLWRAESIEDSDFLPGKSFSLADGTVVKSQRFLLRSLKVGGETVNRVEASIGTLDGHLLLGQSFLRRFGAWSVDNKGSHLLLTK